GIGNRVVDSYEFQIGAAVLDIRPADHVEIFVPTKTEVEGQLFGDFPIVLAVDAELLGGDVEVGIAVGNGHASDQASSAEFLRISCRIAHNHGGIDREVDFEGRTELEKASLDGVVD